MVKLLKNNPSDQDLFGGAHQKVADGIYSVVKNDIYYEGHRNTLALTGPLGSGKSTIIELTNKKIKADSISNVKIFTFNAWHHSGESLKQAFLEELFIFLCHEEWLNSEEDSDLHENIYASKSEKIDSTSPELSWPLRLLIVYLLTLPILTFSNFEFIWKNIDLLAVYKAWFPIMVILLSCICKGTKAFDTILVELFKKEPTTTKTISSESVTNSNNKFLEVFRDLISRALTEEHKLIIVIDDLDRLEAEKIREVTDALQIFTDYSFGKTANESSLKNLWFLVCFDKEKLSEAFYPAQDTPYVLNLQGLISEAPEQMRIADSENKQQAVQKSNEYIGKQFLMEFKTPLPILDKQREFIEQCLKEAFPDISGEDTEIIYWLYYRKKLSSLSTPRDIKTFINNLCSTYIQWGDEIPIRVQALYTLVNKTSSYNSIMSEIAEARELYKDISDSKEWEVQYSTLVFNRDNVPLAAEAMGAFSANDCFELKDIIEKGYDSKVQDVDRNALWFAITQAMRPILTDVHDIESLGSKVRLFAPTAEFLLDFNRGKWRERDFEDIKEATHDPYFTIGKYYSRLGALFEKYNSRFPESVRVKESHGWWVGFLAMMLQNIQSSHAKLVARIALEDMAKFNSFDNGDNIKKAAKDYSRLVYWLNKGWGSIETCALDVFPDDEEFRKTLMKVEKVLEKHYDFSFEEKADHSRYY